MSRFVAFTLIVSKELAEEISKRIRQRFAEEDDFLVRSVQNETYWKDSKLSISIFEFAPSSAKSQSEWEALFDQIIYHNSITRDNDSLEIAHFSAVGNRNDPFAVLYIPVEWVAEESTI